MELILVAVISCCAAMISLLAFWSINHQFSVPRRLKIASRSLSKRWDRSQSLTARTTSGAQQTDNSLGQVGLRGQLMDGTIEPLEMRIPERDIVAVSSIGYNQPNQDACGVEVTQNVLTMAVADGLGGTGPACSIVATAAVEHFLRCIRERSQGQNQENSRLFDSPSGTTEHPTSGHSYLSSESVDEIFEEISEACYTTLKRDHVDYDSPPLSTLIGVVDLPDELVLIYVGDGGAMLTTGRLVVARNLLVQHWDRNARHTLSISPAAPVSPAMIRIRKNFAEGEVFVIGSDGAIPSQHTLRLLHTIRSWYETHDVGHLTPAQISLEIEGVLHEELNRRAECGELTDDATLGVIVTNRAAQYWRRHYNKLNPSQVTTMESSSSDSDQ